MLTRKQPDNKGACDLWISTLQNAKRRLPPEGSITIYSVQELRESENLLNLQKWLCSKSRESLDQVKWITMVRKKKNQPKPQTPQKPLTRWLFTFKSNQRCTVTSSNSMDWTSGNAATEFVALTSQKALKTRQGFWGLLLTGFWGFSEV